jgi:thiamine pyrophosphokinase
MSRELPRNERTASRALYNFSEAVVMCLVEDYDIGIQFIKKLRDDVEKAVGDVDSLSDSEWADLSNRLVSRVHKVLDKEFPV